MLIFAITRDLTYRSPTAVFEEPGLGIPAIQNYGDMDWQVRLTRLVRHPDRSRDSVRKETETSVREGQYGSTVSVASTLHFGVFHGSLNNTVLAEHLSSQQDNPRPTRHATTGNVRRRKSGPSDDRLETSLLLALQDLRDILHNSREQG